MGGWKGGGVDYSQKISCHTIWIALLDCFLPTLFVFDSARYRNDERMNSADQGEEGS